MELTREQIEADIAVYQHRLHKAQQQLDAPSPKGRIPYRKVKATRHRLEAEVAHVLGLIRLASEALAELEQVSDCIN